MLVFQGWKIRGFEDAQAPPEQTSAPSHRQKHRLEIKENEISKNQPKYPWCFDN